MRSIIVRCVLVSVLLSALAFAGCGDDDEPPPGEPKAGAGGRSGSGGAGRGASAGSSAAGSPAASSVQCGSTTCEVSPALGGFATACCADEAKGTCGMSFMGMPCGGAASGGDPRCPSLQAMGVFTIPSCCTADGMCGIDASMFGFGGCTDLAAAAQQSMSMGSGTVIPAPRACDSGDAGAADAGR